jgi:hypothetical protein
MDSQASIHGAKLPSMDHLYTLYDALLSINVPSEKARAVVDAMERDMNDRIATKADFRHLGELFAKDVAAINARIEHQTHVLTVRLILVAAGLVPAIVAAQKLL